MGATPSQGAVRPVARFGGTSYRDAADAYDHGCSFVSDWSAAVELAGEYRRRDGVPMVVLSCEQGYQVIVAAVGLFSPFVDDVAAVSR